jgi:hypothetical protein
MLFQIVTGIFVSAITVVLSAGLISVAIHTMTTSGDWLMNPVKHPKTALALALVSIWLTVVLLMCVGVWALTFLILGIFDSLEPAVYFAIVSFTTLGFGDVLLPTEWRLLSGICAANGLLLFALCAAFLVEFFHRIHLEMAKQHRFR